MPNVAALRQLLEARYPDAAPLAHRLAASLPTGLSTFDRILPGGGLPRGKLTAWHAEASGATLLRATCRAVLAAGERAAWIDSTGMVSLEPAETTGTLYLHPTSARHAFASAEQLLASGGLALVVLTSPSPDRTTAVRLARTAREGGAALVLVARDVAVVSLRIRSRFLAERYRWVPGPFGNPALPHDATIEVQVDSLGWKARTTLTLPCVPYGLRLSPSTAFPDRRGGRACTS